MSGQERLKSCVMEKELCSGCGMCVELCPYIKAARDSVKVIHPCGLEQGTCYSACPKTFLDVNEMDRFVFGGQRQDQALGVYSDIYFARAAGRKAGGAQYGGAASALMAFAVDSGMAGGAVLAGGGALEPRPVFAGTAEEVLAAAGSKYTAVPTLAALNRAVRDGLRKIGLVGRPCQVEAVRKMQQGFHTAAHLDRKEAVELSIGLFCFWSLAPEFYDFLAEKAGGEEITRVDIPVEGMTITTSGGSSVWPVEQVRKYIKKSCQECLDCTSEWADISVGSTEFDPAYNTLVVRTDTGRSLLEQAVAKGVLEIKPYPSERLPILRKAALNKKMRVLQGAGGGKPPYLGINDEYLSEIQKQWEVLQ